MNIFSQSTLKNTALRGHIRRLITSADGPSKKGDKRCGGCAKTTCSG